MDDDIVAQALAATMLGSDAALRQSALGAGMSPPEPERPAGSFEMDEDVKSWEFPDKDTEAHVRRDTLDNSIKFISPQRFFAKILDSSDNCMSISPSSIVRARS